MIKGKKISQNNRIGIITPASPVDLNKTEKGKEYLETLGFEVKLGENASRKYTYLAGSDQQRANEINEMFRDDSIDAIFCTRGGYGTPRLLDLLDYDLIKNNPKIIVGFSDITAILNAIMQETSLITFHGPMLASNMSKKLDDLTFKSLFNILKGIDQDFFLKNPGDVSLASMNSGKASGRIVGGNLALVCSLMGTPYEIDTQGKILFLEDIGEKPYRIDRMLTQLRLAGKFNDAAGIILGNWNDCTDKDESFTIEELFDQIIKPCGKPIIVNFQSGHCTPMLTLPIGAMAEIDSDRKTVKILEKSVE